MNDHHLADLLEARATDVRVGPPPLAEMHRAVRRRRSYVAVLTAAAVVLLTVGLAVVWSPGSDPTRQRAPVATDPPAVDVAPEGFRWVGLGRAAVAVPDAWPTNATRCGTPMRDTVIVDVGPVETCSTSYPDGVTSVEVRRWTDLDDLLVWSSTEVDGEAAQRSTATKAETYDGRPVYDARVHLPGQGVVFEATSTASQEAVEDALDRIAVLDTLVAVPGISPANYETADQTQAGRRYVRDVERAGLVAEVRTERRAGIRAGFVLGAAPAPGTVVEPGSVVTVTVTR